MSPLKKLFKPNALMAHLLFLLLTALAFLLLMALLRGALLAFNHDLIGDASTADLAQAFFNGLRFDLRLLVYIDVPLLLALLCRPLMLRRTWQLLWLNFCAAVLILLGMIELNFYQEFHQRLNALVFQYLQEDAKTVLSMLWYGFPVVRLLGAWLLLCTLFAWLLFAIHRATRSMEDAPSMRPALLLQHALAFVLCVAVSVLAARGTLRQGPPLRWGDAFTTESVFANHLGLNGDAARRSACHYPQPAADRKRPPGRCRQRPRAPRIYPTGCGQIAHTQRCGHPDGKFCRAFRRRAGFR